MGTCDGWPVMTQEFLSGVRSIVEPVFTELGFQLDEYDDDVDEWGRKGSVVFFRSEDCKIQIYDSTRDGSINCMIAALDAQMCSVRMIDPARGNTSLGSPFDKVFLLRR